MNILIFVMFIFILPIVGLFLMADEDTREMGEKAMVIGLVFRGIMSAGEIWYYLTLQGWKINLQYVFVIRCTVYNRRVNKEVNINEVN